VLDGSADHTGEVINDLDSTITSWLSALVPYASMSLTPSRDGEPATPPERPTVILSLVEVREETAAGIHGWSTHRSDEGAVVGRIAPNRRYWFTFLITASAADTLTEHAVLGAVLTGLAQEDVVPEAHLKGALSDCGRMLLVRCAPERPDLSGHDRWRAWQLLGRTSLELQVLAPLPASALQEVAQPPSHVDLRSSGPYRPLPAQAGPPGTRRPSGRVTEG